MFCCFPLLTVGDILLPVFGNFEAVFHCEDLFLCWSSNCSFTGVNCWSHPISYCTTVQAIVLLAFSRMLTVGATLFSMVLAIQATMLLAFSRALRVHPRKDQAGAAQAILPISMKLGQFEGVHPKLLHSKFKEIWSKPGGVDTPPCFFFKK